MKTFLVTGSGALLASSTLLGEVGFLKPLAVMAGDERIRVESPGYASPGLGDIDGDGRAELLVGQFSKGKIQVFRHGDGLIFKAGTWLEAGGEVAEVPGVW